MARRGVQSMTGYGRASRSGPPAAVTVELRSTNHRFLELDARLPNGLVPLQPRVAELLRGAFQRGHIDVYIAVHANHLDRRRVTFDERLLARYHEALLDLKARFGLKGGVTLEHLLALPQAVAVSEERVAAERLWEPVRQAVAEAVRALVQARRREGGRLAADLRRQVQTITQHVAAIKRRLPKALAEQERYLRSRLNELLGNKPTVPLAQLQQAVALVRDVDIHEELVRIDSHVAHIRQLLGGGGLVGKPLDFIAQELMRETNTLGAKASDAQVARHVVDIKGCIEKIREQVQNLE